MTASAEIVAADDGVYVDEGSEYLPVLYQKTQTGAIQTWQVKVEHETGCSLIVTTYGQLGGKLQQSSVTIWKGKNEGKKNATTHQQQAEKEARALWTKQLKKGYLVDLEAARAGAVDSSVIEGGFKPMLAPNKSYPKDPDLKKAIVLPCYFQPKLDGMRCTVEVVNGQCSLWTRTRKRIKTVPHIVAAIEEAFKDVVGTVKADGELYNHDYKDRFEDLMSILRGDEPDPEGEYLNAQLHLYDLPEQDVLVVPTNMSTAFSERLIALLGIFHAYLDGHPEVHLVDTVVVKTWDDLHQRFLKAEDDGYEGGIARNMRGPYESGKRSKHLQKMKNFIDDEFPILGVQDGKGKASEVVIKFIVQLPNGKLGYPTYKATQAKRREMWEHPERWTGKKLTVTFKRWTADGNLYLPVAKGIRDYE